MIEHRRHKISFVYERTNSDTTVIKKLGYNPTYQQVSLFFPFSFFFSLFFRLYQGKYLTARQFPSIYRSVALRSRHRIYSIAHGEK